MKRLVHIITLLVVLQTHAQQPVYRHLTEDDGLPDNEIYYLYQDKKGIIWISTNSGLCRYNGQSVQYFSNPLLKAKSTGCIKEDSFGRIWVNNFSGQLFYVQNDSLVIMKLPGTDNLNSLSQFTIGPKNELAVPSATGSIVIYKPLHTTGAEDPVYALDTVLKTANACPYYDSQGTLWATHGSDEKQSSIIAYNNRTVSSFYIQDPLFQTSNNYVFELGHKMYSFERERSNLYVNNGKEFVLQRTLDIPGFKLVEPLHNGDLAYCTNSGLFISKEKSNTINKLFEGQTISAFCEDNKGNLWVGTLTEGIYFIPKTGLTRIIAEKPDVDYNNITALSAGPGKKLMLGFLNGELGCINENLVYQKLQPANISSTKMQFVFYSPELQLLNWHNNEIYQSSFSATDTKVNPYRGVGYASKDLCYIPQWNAALIANPVDISLISLDKERIADKLPADWVKRYDTGTVFSSTMQWPQQSILLSKERGRAVYFDKATQTLWGADKNGITVYKQNEKKSILWNNEPLYATCFYEHDGMVWAGSFSQGITGIKNEKAIKQFTVKDGLASNTVYKIIGSKDHLWIYTDKGLQYFDIPKERFFLVDKTLGLPSYKINGMALVNEQLFISTPKGLLSVPDTIEFEGPENSTTYLQAVYCNGKIIGSADNNFNTSQNNFIFKVETPVYSNRALLRYQYRLKGADKEMLIVGLDKAVFEYRSLQSGHYEFQLQLTDAKGNSIGAPITFLFSIDPPFYQTIWFVALCAIFLGLIIFYLVRKRIELIKKRADEKLERAKLESELKQSQLSGIKAQMNPHFMFNALNSIQEFILLNEKKQANMYMGKFADLMRMTLDMSNKKEVKLEEEIKILQLYLELESLRFEEHFSYTLTIDENVDKEHTYIPAMLIQPNIENAVKHGLLHKQGEKRLDVHFFILNNTTLCCTVTDNGIGRKRSGEINSQRLTKHTSFATGATQRRLELLNHDRKQQPIKVTYQDLYDIHENAAGTEVTICIPLT